MIFAMVTASATPYFERLAAAFVRGTLDVGSIEEGHRHLFCDPLASLTSDELRGLIETGRERGLRLHRFKRTMGLPRVKAVLGALRSLQPSHLLDVGSGRGAFLWPLLEEFQNLEVTAIDRLDHRIRDMEAVRCGGVTTLSVVRADATSLPFADRAFDVVTVLEVLEHIPDFEGALAEICRVCSRAVVLSVPSKPDDNPEHIHLFNEGVLRNSLARSGIAKVRFKYVLNHLIAVAIKPVP